MKGLFGFGFAPVLRYGFEDGSFFPVILAVIRERMSPCGDFLLRSVLVQPVRLAAIQFLVLAQLLPDVLIVLTAY